MATLHLMIGLPCSGKTTKALELEKRYHALRLTPDEWQLALFGNDINEPEHDDRHTAVEQIMWKTAKAVLQLGTNVILDFGCWSKDEREDFRKRTLEIGADFKLHYMDVPLEELYHRIDKRNMETGVEAGVFHVTKEELQEWASVFEPPSMEELNQ